ncbi:hypothetical protein [Kitasatospora cineracea]|uniref:Mce-associated membrane protein n=1 Tax=Kitasatospora cineracea TaxID=88074 RepID=A0A3N4SI43_9ACTN|nr:hypothetical protein [Kitasatospora cineracea]RPE36174.1 hypothetical protein EDD38_4542 [Kitasatospora cineracea]
MLRRTALLLAAALPCAAACTAQDRPAPSTGRAAAAPQAPEHSGQSLWHVIDADGRTTAQLPDDDPVVSAVRKPVVLHSGAVDNRDERILADSTAQEFSFYAPAFADRLRAQHYDTKLAELFTANHLATRQVGIAWYRSTLPEDLATAKVEMESTIEFTAADPGYLTANGFKLDQPYTQHRTVGLARSGDRWVITAIDKTALQPGTAPTS